MRQDLRRFKALIETGEIPTIDGQTHGPRDFLTGMVRMVDPERPPRRAGGLGKTLSALRLERVEKGEIDPSFVISHRVSIEEAPAMYRKFRDKEDHCTKVVLDPWSRAQAA